MSGRSIQRGFGVRYKTLMNKIARTHGNLDRCTVMAVVNSHGRAFKPCVILPEKQPLYRKVGDVVQTVQDFLPDCYLHYRDPAGVDSQVFYEWGKCFV